MQGIGLKLSMRSGGRFRILLRKKSRAATAKTAPQRCQ
jgi:hypothetical protein